MSRAILDDTPVPTPITDAVANMQVIEAVFENMSVKEKVFSQLDKVCKEGAILASNTSYLDIDRLADSTNRAKDVIGSHFFSPANVMKLLEIVRATRTAPDVVQTLSICCGEAPSSNISCA